MFKKELVERSRSLLKNKDVKRLKEKILAQYAIENEDELSCVFTSKTNVTELKLVNKVSIYLIEDIPYFFDILEEIGVDSSRGVVDRPLVTIFPTIYLLWRMPTLIKTYLIHPPVSSYILRGADLMLPGVMTIKNLNDLQVNEHVSIRVFGNPWPFAVGYSCASYNSIVVNRRSGKAMTVLHYYGDFLTQLAFKGKANANSQFSAPNSGFSMMSIYSLDGYTETVLVDEDGEEDEVEDDNEEADDGVEGEEVEGEDDENNKSGLTTTIDIETMAGSLTIEDTPLADHDEVANDNILVESFLKTLKYVIKDSSLPILASAFWSMILKCSSYSDSSVTATHALDIKKTSYKKVTNFLDNMQRTGMLTLQDNNGVVSIVSIQRVHDLYKGIKVENPDHFRKFMLSNSQSDQSSASNTASSEGKINVVDLYKLPKHAVKYLFGDMKGQYGKYLKLSEVKEALIDYIKSKNLEDPTNKSSLNVPSDDPLYKYVKQISNATVTKTIETHKAPEARVSTLEMSREESDDEVYSSDDDGEHTYRNDMTGGTTVAGVWFPSHSSDAVKKVAPQTEWKPISLPRSKNTKNPVGSVSSDIVEVGGDAVAVAAKEPVVITNIKKEDLMRNIHKELSCSYGIVAADGSVTIASTKPSVEIVVESRMGSKTVTKIRGLELFGIDLTQFAQKCQKKFACSATATLIPGMVKEREVIIQGHLASEITVYLNTNNSIPIHLITTKLLKGVKPKKK